MNKIYDVNWIVTLPCNTEKVVYNLNKFCKGNNLDMSNLSLVAKGTRKHHKGYKVRYYDDSQ